MTTKGELEEALAQLLQPGEDVLVHSSMSAVGPLEGGADYLRDAILDRIGSKGTLIMLSSTRSEFVKTGIFDVKNSKSDVGALGESVRLHRDAFRSICPMVSFVAIGKRSVEYTQVYNSFLEPSSPMIRLRENGGKILLYGIGYAKCTMYHLSEERLRVDYNFYKEFNGTLIDWDGSSKPVTQKYYVRKSMSTEKDAGPVGELFEKSEYPVWKAYLGQGLLRSFYAGDFDDFCTKELQKNARLFLKNLN